MSIIDNYLSPKKHKNNKKKISCLNSYFDKIYVINLKRSVSRLLRISQQLKSYGIKYEIFDAIDGGSIQDPIGGQGLKIGEYAYLLTWAKLLKHVMQQDNIDRILIFEDDIIMCDDFDLKVNEWLNVIPKNALILLFGASQLPHLRNSINTKINAFKPGLTDGSFSIGLHKKVFPILLEQVELYNNPFDSGPLRYCYKHEDFKDFCYVAYPHLVIADVTNSYIRNAKDMRVVAEKLDWNLSDFTDYNQKYKKQHKIALTLYGTFEDEKISDLFNDPCIYWDILVIFNSVKQTLVDHTDNTNNTDKTKKHSIKIHHNTVSNIKIAQEIANNYFTNDKPKYDIMLFYDLSLRMDTNLLNAISYLFQP